MVKKLIVSLPIHCTMETLTPLLMILTLRAPDRIVRHIYIYLFYLFCQAALLQAQICLLFFPELIIE